MINFFFDKYFFSFFRIAGAVLFVLCFHVVFADCPDVVASFTTSQVNICGTGPTVISFTNTSSGANAGTADFAWYRNGVLFDNTSGLTAPTTSTVSAAGNYTFRLIVTDPSVPCADTATVVVTVHQIPNAAFVFNNNNSCAGTTISFTNNSTGTSAATTYLWNFGDGQTSTQQNPSHVYAAGGTYTVTQTVTNFAGCSDVQTQTITVMDIPAVSIAGDDGDGDITNCLLPGNPTTSETVNFTNTTTGAVSYLWDFGDGQTSTAQNPTHTYTSYGTFTVTMTATHANGCTATATLTVVFEKYVSSALTLDITEYSGCTPHPLTTLTNLSVNANTYTWNFGDGTPPVVTTSSVPPAHNYTTAGTYTISLTAANSCNSAQATISPIVIVGGPNSGFTSTLAPIGNLGCAPQNVNFTNQSSGTQPANNYFWSMGNGNTYTNVTTPPVQNYATQGTYQVMMVAGNACGYDTTITNLVIDSIPIADIQVNPLEGCSPLTVTTTNNSSGNNVSYAWYVDGVYTSSAQNLPQQIFTAPAGNTAVNHTISLTVSNHCGTRSDAETVLVHPAVDAIFSMSDDSICVGESILFTDASRGDFLNWNWDFGEGSTSVLQGPHTITYTVPGTYQIREIVSGFCGVDTLIRNLVVHPYPVADISANPDSACVPLNTTFSNNSTTGGTYNWNFGAGAAPAVSNLYNPPLVNYATAGTATVVLSVNVFGCVSTDTLQIVRHPLPLADFTLSPATGCSPLLVDFTNTSPLTPGDTYQWNLGNGTSTPDQQPLSQTYTAATSDSLYTIMLVVTTANGCTDTATSTITVHPLPVADFTPLPDTVCALTPIGFLNNSTGASSFAWTFGDGGISSAISPSYTYSTQDVFNAQLIASTVFSCSDTVLHQIVIDPVPSPGFAFSIECVGDTTVFTDASTGSVTEWLWDFGDGSPASVLQNPAHVFPAAGLYNVSLTVTNAIGCSVTLIQGVTVNAVPAADFSANSFCLGQNTQFSDASSGVPVSWIWDFGDGSGSNVQHPAHVYANTGTYTVQLIAFGGAGCSDTVSLPLTITGIPAAGFLFTEACTNDTTFFVDTSGGSPDTFVWDFGDGTSDVSNNPDPFHIYSTSGAFTVTLTAGYTASGCTHSVTQTVNAFPRTDPSFISNTPCLGAATNFVDATTGNPTEWLWNFGDGSPDGAIQNPTHIYTAPGLYTVSLQTENNFGCIDSFQTSIEVYPLPVADFSNNTICDGFATAFSDLSISAAQWNWNFGDGSANSISQNPFHLFPASGTYQVELIVNNVQGCSDTMIRTVTVHPNPTADFSFSTSCFSYPTIFTDASVDAIEWDWSFGDGSANDTIASPSYVYSSQGNFSAQLIVTNNLGCKDTLVQPIAVLPQPQAGFENNTVCAGQTVQFTDTSFGAPVQWSWSFGDGTTGSSDQHPVHTFLNGGVYNVTLIAGNPAGCLDTVVVPVEVFTVPDAAFTADTVCLFNITAFTDLTTDAAPLQNWFWDFGDGNHSFDQHPTYIYQNPGIYDVTLTVSNTNGCDTTIVQQVVVNDIPVAAFSADTVCLGAATTFTDASTGFPTQWTWSFGDGNVATGGPVVQHTYAGPGSYIVTLVAEGNGNNCEDFTFGVVTVSTDATAGVILPDTVCQNEQFSFDDDSQILVGSIVSEFWDMGDGTMYATSPSVHTYASPGVYFITHTVTTSGSCTSSVEDTIVVNEKPVASFTSGNACSGVSMQFTDQSVNTIVGWSWNFGDGSIAGIANPAHSYATPGSYAVTLIVQNNFSCSDTFVSSVEVSGSPLADFTHNITCLGTPVSFFDASTVPAGDTIVAWNWFFGDGATSVLEEDQHTFTDYTDTFMVTFVVTTSDGCTDTIQKPVPTLPIVEFDFSPSVVNGCAPLEVVFTDLSVTTGASTIVGWVWNFDDGHLSFGENPVHVYPDSGNYFVSLQLTTSDGCVFSDTLDFPITVYPQPVPGFEPEPYVTNLYQPDVQINDQSAGAMLWEYAFGDGYYSNESNPLHTYYEPGTYTIMQIVTNSFGCRDTFERNIVIEEVTTFFAPNAVSPDGNGLNDVFYVTGSNILNIHWMVFDRWGERIFDGYSISEGWDCTHKGEKVKQDVYVWKAEVEYTNGDIKEYYGHVTVLRR